MAVQIKILTSFIVNMYINTKYFKIVIKQSTIKVRHINKY